MVTFFYNLFVRNRSTKLLALLIGMVAWFHFNSQISEVKSFNVQVQVNLQEEDYWLLTEASELVCQASVYGAKHRLAALNDGDRLLRVTVEPFLLAELAGKTSNAVYSFTYPVNRFDDLPPGIHVNAPIHSVQVSIDRVIEIELPVEVSADDPEWAFVPSDLTVRLRGPRSILNEMTAVRTKPVLYEYATLKSKVGFDLQPVAGRDIKVTPTTITVDASPKRQMVSVLLEAVPVAIFASPQFLKNYTIEFDAGALLPKLALEVPEGVTIDTKKDVRAYVRPEGNLDLDSTSPQVIEVEIELNHKDRDKINVLDDPPRTVKITITKK